jgi:hypothetical protein
MTHSRILAGFAREQYSSKLVDVRQGGCNPHSCKNPIRESEMKRFLSASSLFLFAFSSMTYAASNESGSLKFPTAVRVGTTNLPAGTYAIHWQPGAGEVEVKISGNGHSVDVPATVAPSASRDELLTHREGTTEVVEGFTVKATSFTLKSSTTASN